MYYRDPRRQKTERAKSIFKETMAESVLNLGKETDIQIQEAPKEPTGINSRKPTLRHIIIKLSKFENNKRILKAARKKTTC